VELVPFPSRLEAEFSAASEVVPFPSRLEPEFSAASEVVPFPSVVMAGLLLARARAGKREQDCPAQKQKPSLD
jgi:hypothetical protein